MVYLTKDHYIRLFRKQTGFTPNVYITNKKMERAELLLLSTDIPIKQIASDLGYEDLSYFIRLFKKYANTTPLQYRNMTN
jgi:AraC-like DNA-binding protein